MKTLPAVFVVDDEEVICRSFEMLLNIIKVPVSTFTSADEFLAEFDKSWTGFVFIDLRMAGMNGLELLKKLQLLNSSLLPILMTGNADETSLQQALDAGAIDVLEKPFSVKRIKEILQCQ